MLRPSLAILTACTLLAASAWGIGFASPNAPTETTAASPMNTPLRSGMVATLAGALLTLPACTPSEAARVAGVYEIDAKATGQNSGLMGFLVESAVTGSTLELRSDMTYIGRKDGKAESAGTWTIQDGQLAMQQTHEQGKPVKGAGAGTIRDGIVTVKTKKRGIVVTLVFSRKS